MELTAGLGAREAGWHLRPHQIQHHPPQVGVRVRLCFLYHVPIRSLSLIMSILKKKLVGNLIYSDKIMKKLARGHKKGAKGQMKY